MKITELEEGNIYRDKDRHSIIVKVEKGILYSPSFNDDGSVNHWYVSKENYNTLVDIDFTDDWDNANNGGQKLKELMELLENTQRVKFIIDGLGESVFKTSYFEEAVNLIKSKLKEEL
jgi:hypothetical protein